MDHGEVCAALIAGWGLPDAVVAACRWHHALLQAPASARPWAEVVHLADWLAAQLGHPAGTDAERRRFREDARRDLGFEDEALPDLVAEFTAIASGSDLPAVLAK